MKAILSLLMLLPAVQATQSATCNSADLISFGFIGSQPGSQLPSDCCRVGASVASGECRSSDCPNKGYANSANSNCVPSEKCGDSSQKNCKVKCVNQPTLTYWPVCNFAEPNCDPDSSKCWGYITCETAAMTSTTSQDCYAYGRFCFADGQGSGSRNFKTCPVADCTLGEWGTCDSNCQQTRGCSNAGPLPTGAITQQQCTGGQCPCTLGEWGTCDINCQQTRGCSNAGPLPAGAITQQQCAGGLCPLCTSWGLWNGCGSNCKQQRTCTGGVQNGDVDYNGPSCTGGSCPCTLGEWGDCDGNCQQTRGCSNEGPLPAGAITQQQCTGGQCPCPSYVPVDPANPCVQNTEGKCVKPLICVDGSGRTSVGVCTAEELAACDSTIEGGGCCQGNAKCEENAQGYIDAGYYSKDIADCVDPQALIDSLKGLVDRNGNPYTCNFNPQALDSCNNIVCDTFLEADAIAALNAVECKP